MPLIGFISHTRILLFRSGMPSANFIAVSERFAHGEYIVMSALYSPSGRISSLDSSGVSPHVLAQAGRPESRSPPRAAAPVRKRRRRTYTPPLHPFHVRRASDGRKAVSRNVSA